MDKKKVNPVKNKKAYVQIIDKIITLITQGEINYGDKLYNEQELMELLNVSRPTLREALRVLEFLGIITVSPRKGIIVCNPEDNTSYSSLIYCLLFEKVKTKNLFELLSFMQIELVDLASKKGSVQDFLNLKLFLDKIKESISLNYKTFLNSIFNFHLQMLKCANNKIGEKLFKTFYMLIKIHLEQIVMKASYEKREKIYNYYFIIYESIISGKSEEAQNYMKELLDIPYKLLTEGNITNI